MVSEVEKVSENGPEVEKVTFRSLYTISRGPFLGPAKTPEDFLRVSLKRSTFQTVFSSKNHFFDPRDHFFVILDPRKSFF